MGIDEDRLLTWHEVELHMDVMQTGMFVCIDKRGSDFVLTNRCPTEKAFTCVLYPTLADAMGDALFDFNHTPTETVFLCKRVGGGCLLTSPNRSDA